MYENNVSHHNLKFIGVLSGLIVYGDSNTDNQINWCTNTTCTKYIPFLHFNDEFVLEQVITTASMKGYYLTGTEVYYTGSELNKKATPLSINNTKQGQAIIKLKAEIEWNNVTIRVNSTQSNTSGRRVLVQTESDQVTGETQLIECIKAEGSETCPTCEQECEVNGFVQNGCQECFSEQRTFTILALLIVLKI